MIKAVIFDLGSVYFINGTKKLIETISKKYFVFPAEVANIIDGGIGAKYRASEIGDKEFWNYVKSQLPLKETTDKLKQILFEGYGPIEGTISLVNRLGKKYRVAFLSDNVKERADYLEENFHFRQNFETGIFSHQVGVRKPDKRIYDAVLKKLNLNPEECVFIDDKESSLKPALELGMKTILFASAEETEEALKKLGLEF
ncbi:MAG: HAD family phosphatase [Candidatus Woesearchaeota archaeon]